MHLMFILKKRAPGATTTVVPSTDDALALNQYSNSLILLYKTIDMHLLPLVVADTSVAKTYKVQTDCFLQAES